MDAPKVYLRKPWTVEAFQVTPDNLSAVIRWANAGLHPISNARAWLYGYGSGVTLRIDDDIAVAFEGWWVVKYSDDQFGVMSDKLFRDRFQEWE